MGDFDGDGRIELLFYYARDDNWWLGRHDGNQFQWANVSNTSNFGNLLTGSHRIWTGDFDGDGRTEVLFHYSRDGNWFLGDFNGARIDWTQVSNTAHFGNLFDGRHLVLIADLDGDGSHEVLFQHTTDGNWWLGRWSNH
jgi:hypothetical protein